MRPLTRPVTVGRVDTATERAPGRAPDESPPSPLRRAAKQFRARFKDVRKRWKYWKNTELRAANRALVKQGAPDGMPLPPPFLVYKVSSKFDLRRHLESGPQSIELIEKAIAPAGLSLEQFTSILDWGCGCGRVVRHLAKRFDAEVHGCDYNPQLIRWCQKALPCAEFKVCGLAPPLPYPDQSFDFLYAISVLTHIPVDLQIPWLAELRRVLKPGGHALVSVHGLSRAHALVGDDRRRFDAGECVVTGTKYPGTNLCGAYHPLPFLRDVMGAVMPMVAHIPDGAADSLQDYVLFARR